MKRIESWLSVALDEIAKCENETLTKGMFGSCGADCARKSGIINLVDKTKSEIQNLNTLEEIVEVIDKNFQGSFTKIDGGFIIEYGPWECDCEIVRDNNIKSHVFCNCTAGFHEYIWGCLFNKKVKVDILETVLRGSKICKLKVMIKESCI